MVVLAIELIKGKEITYQNPYPVPVGISDTEQIAKNKKASLILKPRESISIAINKIFVSTFEDE